MIRKESSLGKGIDDFIDNALGSQLIQKYVNRLSNMTEEERQEYLKQQKKENNRRLYERNKQKNKTNINALENA
jgi:hypothetical protein